MTVVLGAVAYDPKVVTIWDGFRVWLRGRGVDFDYVLYSNYERQVEELIAGRIDVAWNSPLAWVRTRRLGAAGGISVQPMFMRDTDCDLTSVIVVREDSPARQLTDLKGSTIATGAIDSPQATLLPLSLLVQQGLNLTTDVTIRRFDIGVGLHGDHIGGERDAAKALVAGKADAACVMDGNLLLFAREGTFPAGSVRVLGRTDPYDHCMMTAGPTGSGPEVDAFTQQLLAMSYADAQVRPLLDLEGLQRWVPARTELYSPLERAVDELQFYDAVGGLSAGDYRP
jgi:ABC-type phosphate/phosphonate transport system substrate-binding protein